MTPASFALRLECVAALCLARVALRLAPRRCLSHALRNRAGGTDFQEQHARVVRALAEVVESNLVASNCLHRSIALQSMLRRRGAAAVVRIGASRERPHFPGHAWVEHEGVALNEPQRLHERFARLVIHGR
jgi:hypothetical protein